jgi:2-methylisocitrate lyase-like PEP mutase family enzyme
LQAGADAIFIEAPGNLAEVETIVKEIKAPLVYNMTESGKSPMLPVAKLAALGFRVILFPSDLQRAFIGAAKRVLEARLKGEVSSLDGMGSFKERDELVDLNYYLELEKRYVR